MQGVTIWLTGLVGAGKSTLTQALARALLERGCSVEVLSGRFMREVLSPELDFSRPDRQRHILRIALICRLLTRNGVFTLVDVVSPDKEARDQARLQIGEFVEIHVSTPLEVCEARDNRGRYSLALAGELRHFPGISAAYEPPEFPELTIDTSQETTQASVERICRLLESLHYLGPEGSRGFSAEDEEKVRQRLEDLGYI